MSVWYRRDTVGGRGPLGHMGYLGLQGNCVGVAEISVDKIVDPGHSYSGNIIRGWYRLFPSDSTYMNDSD